MIIIYISAIAAHDIAPVFIYIAVPEMEHTIREMVIRILRVPTVTCLNAAHESHRHEIVQTRCKGTTFNLAFL